MILISSSATATAFQSTLPRGSDVVMLCTQPTVQYFNPRSLAGATDALPLMACFGQNFNPRSLAGATPCKTKLCMAWGNFNPRSLAGATLAFQNKMLSSRLFQSTLPYGSDQVVYKLKGVKKYFNPRSLAGATCFS